jgi:hypothetical protein
MYEAMRAQKDILVDQQREQQRLRDNITGRLRSDDLPAADLAGLEKRLLQVDERILQLDAQIATADAQLALAAAQPGAVVRQPPDHTDDIIEITAIFSFFFLFVVLMPISVAWARRIWKKNSVIINMPAELSTRLDQIERGVDATALEVERIGEGQRFVTQLLAANERPARVALPPDPGAPPS